MIAVILDPCLISMPSCLASSGKLSVRFITTFSRWLIRSDSRLRFSFISPLEKHRVDKSAKEQSDRANKVVILNVLNWKIIEMVISLYSCIDRLKSCIMEEAKALEFPISIVEAVDRVRFGPREAPRFVATATVVVGVSSDASTPPSGGDSLDAASPPTIKPRFKI